MAKRVSKQNDSASKHPASKSSAQDTNKESSTNQTGAIWRTLVSSLVGVVAGALLTWGIISWQLDREHAYWKTQRAAVVKYEKYKAKLELYSEAVSLFTSYRHLAFQLRKEKLENTHRRVLMLEHDSLSVGLQLLDENNYQNYYKVKSRQDGVAGDITVLLYQMERIYDATTLEQAQSFINHLEERKEPGWYDSELEQILRDSFGSSVVSKVFWEEFAKRTAGSADPAFVEETERLLEAMEVSLETDELAFKVFLDPAPALR